MRGRRRRVAGPAASAAWVSIAVLLAAAVPAPEAAPPAVSYQACTFVFAGRDTLDAPVVAWFSLAAGTSPNGGTAREYRGWLTRADRIEKLFDEHWIAPGAPGRSLGSAYPAAFGVVVQGETQEAGAFHRPVSIAIAWMSDLRAVALTAKELRAEVRRGFDERPSDLLRNADPTSFRWEQGTGGATLTLGLERIEGRLFQEFIACEGTSLYLEEPAAPGHYGNYDRALLWDHDGTFWLVEAARGTTRAMTVSARRGAKLERSESASLARVSMEAFPPARRQIPGGWHLFVPPWEFQASLRALGQAVDLGGPGPRGQKSVRALFGVAGEASAGGAPRPVFGIVEHVQD